LSTHKLTTSEKYAKDHLITLARYLQETASQAESWGGGLLGAIGLKKEGFTMRRRMLYRCLSVLIFSLLLPACQREYQTSLEETRQCLTQKKFNDIRVDGTSALQIIGMSDGRSVAQVLCEVIRIFFKDQFLVSLETIWDS
jgi:ectopic P granules protein 5